VSARNRQPAKAERRTARLERKRIAHFRRLYDALLLIEGIQTAAGVR